MENPNSSPRARAAGAERPVALLVDRDDDSRAMYAEFMKLQAWTTEEAADGPEGLAKALSCRPSIVITETQLPGISGYDLVTLLRRDVQTKAIPIVVVTADAYDGAVSRARNAGADQVLIKPCLDRKSVV